MVISNELYQELVRKAGEQMMLEWIPLHQDHIDGAVSAMGGHGEIYGSDDEHDIWMMWMALTCMGYHVQVVLEDRLVIRD